MKENHYNCIYMYVNKINEHKYVGQAKDFNKRHKGHISESKNKNRKEYNLPFNKAIRKYGIENFDIIILKEKLKNECLINFYECYYIDKYNCLSKENYNVASGGSNGNTLAGKTEEEIKEFGQKQSEAKKGENNPMYGKTGVDNWKSVKIAQYDKKGNLIKTWCGSYEIERKTGIAHSTIIACCKWYQYGENLEEWRKIRKGHPIKSTGRFIWKYID